jgi:type I restriction enzyme S subunit
MKKGWQRRRLGDVLEVQNGYAFDSKGFNPSKGLPLVRIRSLKTGVETETRYDGEYDQSYVVRAGDLLIGMDGEFGCYEWKGDLSLLNQRVCRLQGFSRELLPRFLFYGVNEHLKKIEEITGYATVKHLSSKQILAIQFPVPPLPEQQRIVRVLDEAFAALATAQSNAEKNLQNARALFESHLQSVFTRRGEGWVEKTLGNVCNFLNGFAFKSGDAVSESKTQLVRMGNIYSNRLDLDRSPAFYPDHFAAEYSRYVLAEGDIIMSLTGTTGKEDYGFAVRIPECDHSLLMNQRIMKLDAIRCDIIDSGYLLHYLRSRSFLDILYPTAKGTRQANLSSVTMQSIPVPLPSLDEQKSISAQLNSLSAETQRLTRIYEQKQAALAALKKSLLHQAFTGDL